MTARKARSERIQQVLEKARGLVSRDPRRACNLFLRAARLLRESDERSLLVNALWDASVAAQASGSLNRALRILRKLRKLAAMSGEDTLVARTLLRSAALELERGSVRRARRFARTALKLCPELARDPEADPVVLSLATG